MGPFILIIFSFSGSNIYPNFSFFMLERKTLSHCRNWERKLAFQIDKQQHKQPLLLSSSLLFDVCYRCNVWFTTFDSQYLIHNVWSISVIDYMIYWFRSIDHDSGWIESNAQRQFCKSAVNIDKYKMATSYIIGL